MNRNTQRERIAGPVGWIEVAIDTPAQPPCGLALIAHPHPLHGGTLDNKVAQTLARAWLQLGYCTVRPNFRGVGASEGSYDAGRGETQDLRALVNHYSATLAAQLELQATALPLALAGFSFGAFVAAQLAQTMRAEDRGIDHLTLVGPAVVNFSVPALRQGDGTQLAERALVIHGEQDDVVPLSAVLDWARPQQQPVLVMPGAGHFFQGLLTPLKEWVTTWHGSAKSD